MPIQFNGENLTSGAVDPQAMFAVVVTILAIGFLFFIAWTIYQMVS